MEAEVRKFVTVRIRHNGDVASEIISFISSWQQMLGKDTN